MEKMVADPGIKKVIVVLDRIYAEKADGRKGSVGTETQIISPQIYAKADQDRFVGVASETGVDGKPFLPTFYKSRIYIDLSQSDIYAANFEQLLRWIYDKPAHPKPQLGKRPEFLNENAIQLPTRSRANRAIDLLKAGSSQAAGAIDEYFSVFSESLEMFRNACTVAPWDRTAERRNGRGRRPKRSAPCLEYSPSRWVTESVCCRAKAAFLREVANAYLVCRGFDGRDRLHSGCKYTAKCRRDHLSLVRQLWRPDEWRRPKLRVHIAAAV
jgi:hypothetical protein